MNVEMTPYEYKQYQMWKRGREGESCARVWLKEKLGIKNLFQLDWCFEYPVDSGKYWAAEIKNKEPYEPRPCHGAQYFAQGLNAYQFLARKKFKEDTGIRSLFWVSDSRTHEIYYRDLIELHELTSKYNQCYLTQNDVLVFNLDFFHKDMDYINKNGFLVRKNEIKTYAAGAA